MGRYIRIDNKIIGQGKPCFVIAEAGVNHNGSFELAKQLIEIAAQTGADAIKFQTFQTENLVTKYAPQAKYQQKNIGKRESQFRMLKKLELTYESFKNLKEYAEQSGLVFLSTPFDAESVRWLENLSVEAYKISSGDLTNYILLDLLAKKNKPLILSTGMATLSEVLAAKERVIRQGAEDLIFLHCTSNYPCSFDEVNLRAMITIQNNSRCIVGYSDHTEGILVPALAVTYGASVIEKHFTLDKNLPGPDHKASLNPEELKEMIDLIRKTEMILGSSQKKPSASEKITAKVARKSLVASTTIQVGDQISLGNITAKRPETGIPPSQIDKIIGRIATKKINTDELIEWEYLK